MNVSEYIFSFFAEKGINTAFVITGGQAMWLDDALGKNPNYEVIFTHHEQSAAMSGEAYGRITTRPAITLVTAGPGSVNAMNGVVGGYTDSSPMIIISGQANLDFVKYQEATHIRQHGIQGINTKPLYENVVKYFKTIDDVNKVKKYLEEAYFAATSGRPGPAWLDVPLDIQSTTINIKHQEDYTLPNIKINELSGKQAAKHICERLKVAKRPIILAGQGVALAGARNELVKFVETSGVPILTSRLGIDLINSDHVMYVGRPGNYGERSANFAVQNSDLIISLGCRLASALVGYNPHQFGKHAYKIVVDIDEEEINKPGVVSNYSVVADCKLVLTYILNRINECTIPSYAEWVGQCNLWKDKYPVVQPEYAQEKPVNSYYFVDRLSYHCKSDTAVLVDTGSCFHVASQAWKVKKGQKFLTTGGISSMGYWAACIGACMANDKGETVCITGDGSLQMNIQEFATIKHNNLPIKVFVIDNGGYLLIRHTQRNFMENRLFGEGPNTGVWCPDSLKIAQAYGIKGFAIDSPEEVDNTIEEVLNYDGPAICNVKSPEWQLLIPRVSSDKTSDGKLVAREYSDMYPYLDREEYSSNMIAEDE